MLARDQTRNEAAAAQLRAAQRNPAGSLVTMTVDLSSLASIHRFVTAYQATGLPIHILILNAGVAFLPYSLTSDGIEIQFGTNYVGHFYLTQLLMPVLLSTAASVPVRVVVVSSDAHAGPAIDYSKLPSLPAKAYSGYRSYQQSKYALVLFAYELNRRYSARGITAYSLHPGFILTPVMDKAGWVGFALQWLAFPFAISIPQGTATTVYCAVTPGLDTEEGGAGHYFINSQVNKAIIDKVKPEEFAQLWTWTERLIEEKKPRSQSKSTQ
jgi:retinol dehydrogenase-12